MEPDPEFMQPDIQIEVKPTDPVIQSNPASCNVADFGKATTDMLYQANYHASGIGHSIVKNTIFTPNVFLFF